MIVQSAASGEDHFVMTMAEHTAFAAELASHFGNDEFAAVAPREPMLYLTAHHDAGWHALDGEVRRNPDTGLPYHLVQTPFEEILRTSAASPDFNQRHHPYCGLLSSMHSWGLYNGRYGMSDRVLLDSLAGAFREQADAMLAEEERRQARLKAQLAADDGTADWVEEGHLLQNYKQLQFFDTLALYFNCTPEPLREPAEFTHVPMTSERDADVHVQPAGDGVYELAPYPFNADDLMLSYDGRRLAPAASDAALREQWASAPLTSQHVHLRRTGKSA